MFESITDLGGKLAATGYFIDPVMTQVVFLAAKLQKPLLLEGPAGSGNTHSDSPATEIRNTRFPMSSGRSSEKSSIGTTLRGMNCGWRKSIRQPI